MKKLTVMLLVMTLVFGLAACGNASEKGSTVTETQAQSAEDTGAGNAELNKLYEKENAIIAKHQELWNTVFNNIDKNKAADAGEQNYGTFLETQLDHVKDQFSEADLKKLDKDIEEIKKIEDQVTELTAPKARMQKHPSFRLFRRRIWMEIRWTAAFFHRMR